MTPGDASTDAPDPGAHPLYSNDPREASEPIALDAVQSELAAWGEEVKRRELRTAARKLEARGSLTESDRAVLDAMADRLVARLLAPPTAALDATATDAAFDTEADLTDLFEPIIEEY